jgi:predicted NAD/FAD-binding protein
MESASEELLAEIQVFKGYCMRIAVIGSGISGLTAAWALAPTHSVTLFEAQHRLGGHTNTVDVTLEGKSFPVDTGFLVFNERTYPNLISLFRLLGVDSHESSMTFSVQAHEGALEWCGTDLSTIFAQRRNLLNFKFLGMLRDILRCNRELTAAHLAGTLGDEPLQDWLDQRRFGKTMREWYLIPMTAAIWSTPPSRALEYPVATFARFCHNHGLLSVYNRPRWRTVMGGGREYVKLIASKIQEIRLNTPITSLLRANGLVWLKSPNGQEESFDQVILACHSNEQLALLSDASDDERSVLSRVRYQPNLAVLHTDLSFLPKKRAAWAAWNYHVGASGTDQSSVTYWLNALQDLPTETPVMVTLNPLHAPNKHKVIAHFQYEHPLFDGDAIAAQRDIKLIQGKNQVWFAGAWTRYGFHEDGVMSGLAVAKGLGVDPPWSVSQI